MSSPDGTPGPEHSQPPLDRAERLGHSLRHIHRSAHWPESTGTIQRFRDAETGDEVEIDIDGIQYFGVAEDYLQQIQGKTLLATTQEFVALARKRKQLLQGTSEQVVTSNLELMDFVNSGDSGLGYHHNTDESVLAELIHDGQAPSLGYANPDYFDRLSKFTWRVKPKVSAAEAIQEFIDPQVAPATIVECQATVQAIYYHTILRAVGSKRFDARFGSEEGGQKVGDRLLIQMDFGGGNPLGKYMEDFDPTLDDMEAKELTKIEDEPASAPGNRPAKPGGWYYVSNHRLYTARHSEGIWGGENALYVGCDEDSGQQIWSGLGLDRVTEQEIAEHCAAQFNKPPSAKETETICRRHPSNLSLALPVLGDLSSVPKLPILTPECLKALETIWTHANPKFSSNFKIPNQTIGKSILYLLLKGKPLIQPATPRDLLKEFRLSDLDEPSDISGANFGDWADGGDTVTLTWTNSKIKRTSIYSLVSKYCTTFNLNLVPQLMKLFQQLNDDFEGRATKSMFPVKPGAVFHFPLPSTLAKLVKSPGGFQALGSKVLSVREIEKLRDG